MHIIDRRLNPGGKSLANRQRFLRRAKALVQRAVRESLKDRSINDLDQQGEVSIVQGGIHEPRLHRSREGGDHDYVFPGNREYVEGDTIPRPRGAAGGGGSEAGTGERSEEHTSELQSLMRISYAVFCLKKKNNKITDITHTHKDCMSTQSTYS